MPNRLREIEDEVVPFSDMQLVEIEGSTDDETSDEMLEALAKRYEFDMWNNQFPRES